MIADIASAWCIIQAVDGKLCRRCGRVCCGGRHINVLPDCLIALLLECYQTIRRGGRR